MDDGIASMLFPLFTIIDIYSVRLTQTPLAGPDESTDSPLGTKFYGRHIHPNATLSRDSDPRKRTNLDVCNSVYFLGRSRC